MLNAGDVGLNLLFNREGFNNQIRNLASSLSSALGIGLSTVALVNFTKSSLELGSDLAEVQNVVDVTFGNMAEDINEFASTAITQLGLSETSAKQYASTMGAMLKSMGLSTKQALEMSKAITSLSADMASFYNLDNDMAFEKIRAGISGETEPLKALGINMSVANMEAYALSQGINKAYDSMSQSEQAILRYNYLLSVTADAQGDFARTSDGWANQTRILTEQWNAFKATMGQAFINILSPVVKWLNTVISKLQIAANAFKSFIEQVTGNTDSSNATASIANNLAGATDGANSLTDGLDDAVDSAKEVVKEVSRLQGFDEINLLSKSSDSNDDSPIDMDISSIGNSGNEGISKTTDEAKEMSTVFDGIIGKVKELNELLTPAKIALQSLSNELKRMSDFAFDGLKDFYNSFLKPVAVWTIGEGLPRFINAITNGLAKVNWQKINDSLHGLWISLTPFTINIGEGLLWLWENVLVPFGTWTLNNAVPTFLDLLSGAIDILNPILEVFMELGEWLWNEFLQPTANWTGGIIISALEDLADILKDIGEWMSNNKSVIETFTIIIGSFATVLGLVKLKALALSTVCSITTPVISALGSAIAFLVSPIGLAVLAISGVIAAGVLLYKNCKEFREKVQSGAEEFIEKIKATFKKIKDKIIDPIIIPAIERMKEVWDKHIKGMLDKAVEFVGKLIVGVTDFVDKVIMPIIDVLVDVLAPIVVSVFNYLTDSIGTAVAVICDILGGIFEVLGGIIDFLAGIFTVNWKKCWEGVKSIFKGIWDSLVGIVKWPINLIIDMVNAMVSAINSIISGINEISIDVPDWIPGIGGEKFGFDIPKIDKIPMLAEGGFVEANTPRLAMIGDNTRYGEIVAPENKLSELLDKAVSKGGNSNKVELLLEKLISIVEEGQTVNMNVDGIKLGSAVAKGVNKITKANGGVCPINI